MSLLSDGLVDPAWAQWGICRESATIARFIANSPEMASRYLKHTVVDKYHLAKGLYEIGGNQKPTKCELNRARARSTG